MPSISNMNPPIMCGIARSGSTVVWQVLREIFGEGVIKIHPDTWVPHVNRKTVITMRHPYDVAASRYRTRLSRGGAADGGWLGLEAEIHVMKTHFDGVKRILQHDPNSIVLHYEKFWNRRCVMYDAIEKHLGRYVSIEERNSMDRRFSVEENRKRASMLKNFNEVDSDMIHGNHIGKVAPNTWPKVLPRELWVPMLRMCAPIVEEWGLWDLD